VGWQRTVEQPAHTTTVWAWEKTVVIVKQPGHLTSMKKERGAGTRVYRFIKVPALVTHVDIVYRDPTRSYLKLVLAGLSLRSRVEKVDRENLFADVLAKLC
jgi:hypothetical protein